MGMKFALRNHLDLWTLGHHGFAKKEGAFLLASREKTFPSNNRRQINQTTIPVLTIRKVYTPNTLRAPVQTHCRAVFCLQANRKGRRESWRGNLKGKKND